MSRIRARAQLFRQVQQFFETELRGLFELGQCATSDAIPADNEAGKLPGRFGRHKEIVEIQFGGYFLTIQSPNETPPLGHVSLRDGAHTISGVIDPATWKKFGEHIRSKQRAKENV